MIRKILPYIFLAWLGLGATCERTLELDIDEPPTKLVVNSSFTLGEKVKVNVSKSQYILDNSLPEYLANAIVTLWEGDAFIEKLVIFVDPAERIAPYYVTTNFEPLAATTYTIRVEALGFETVEAHSFIPEPIAFNRLTVSPITEIPATSTFGMRFSYEVNLDFDDPKNEDNFYHLNLFQEILSISVSPDGDTMVDDRRLVRAELSVDNPKVVADAMIGGVLLKDNPTIDGYRFPVEVEIIPEFESLGKVIAELRTVSEEYYLYYTSFSRQQNQSDGPFNDPIVIFNNVENGQGFFAGYNTTQDSVTVNF